MYVVIFFIFLPTDGHNITSLCNLLQQFGLYCSYKMLWARSQITFCVNTLKHRFLMLKTRTNKPCNLDTELRNKTQCQQVSHYSSSDHLHHCDSTQIPGTGQLPNEEAHYCDYFNSPLTLKSFN